MDKISFARLIAFVVSKGASLVHSDISYIDSSIIGGMPVENHSAVKCDDVTLHALMGYMQAGKKIEAIKAHRSLTGYGLKESKDIVEKYLTFKESNQPTRVEVLGK